jgi:hypothetical protein
VPGAYRLSGEGKRCNGFRFHECSDGGQSMAAFSNIDNQIDKALGPVKFYLIDDDRQYAPGSTLKEEHIVVVNGTRNVPMIGSRAASPHRGPAAGLA